MTPIRNDRGRFRSPHANVYWAGRPELHPHVKEGRNEAVGRPTNVAHHGEIREVSLERAEEKSAVDRPNPVCPMISY